MHKSALSIPLAFLASGLAAQAVVTPLGINNTPSLGTTVINVDGAGNAIQAYQQIEMKAMGSGLYRTILTAQLVGFADSALVLGTIDMNTTPPTWTADPNTALAAINQSNAGIDDFAGTLSDDGLVLAWDNYYGAAAPVFPNVATTAYSFICQRSSTSVPFSASNVHAIANVPSGGVDTKIGNRLANGHVILFHIGNTAGVGAGPTNGNIYRSEIDPTTGANSGNILAVTNSGRAGWYFCHSPCPMRDAAGNPVALVNSEYLSTTGQSDGMWSPGVSNDGTTRVIGDGTTGGVYTWLANPAVIGGTIHWATSSSAGTYGDPSTLEGGFVANCDLTSGSGHLALFAPIRPTMPGSFISAVAIGAATTPYAVPPVIGNIEILPTVGITPIALNDANTGLADWAFNSVPPLGLTLATQGLLVDVIGGRILATNTATLRL
jgi:hypothetical protein